MFIFPRHSVVRLSLATLLAGGLTAAVQAQPLNPPGKGHAPMPNGKALPTIGGPGLPGGAPHGPQGAATNQFTTNPYSIPYTNFIPPPFNPAYFNPYTNFNNFRTFDEPALSIHNFPPGPYSYYHHAGSGAYASPWGGPGGAIAPVAGSNNGFHGTMPPVGGSTPGTPVIGQPR